MKVISSFPDTSGALQCETNGISAETAPEALNDTWLPPNNSAGGVRWWGIHLLLLGGMDRCCFGITDNIDMFVVFVPRSDIFLMIF